MNLKRYNDVIIAVIGTVIILGIPAIIAWNLIPTHHQNPPGVIVNKPNEKKPHQMLVVCFPTLAPGTDYQYFPVAAVTPDESATNISLSAGYAMSSVLQDRTSRYSLNHSCHLEYKTRYSIFNVLVRNTSTNEQRLLLSQPAQVVSLSIPDAKCAAGEGDTPCGMLLWVIRDKDTNHDGVVNFKDADTLYASELSAKTLNRLSPADATVLDWTWDALSGEVLMQIRRDVNHDGEFSDADGSEVVSAKVPGVAEGTSILRTDLLQQLQRVVE